MLQRVSTFGFRPRCNVLKIAGKPSQPLKIAGSAVVSSGAPPWLLWLRFPIPQPELIPSDIDCIEFFFFCSYFVRVLNAAAFRAKLFNCRQCLWQVFNEIRLSGCWCLFMSAAWFCDIAACPPNNSLTLCLVKFNLGSHATPPPPPLILILLVVPGCVLYCFIVVWK